jgi:hypothetical protein
VPASRWFEGSWLCEKCASRFEEYDRNWRAHDAGQVDWNTSQHDPFWRGWLTSRELFDSIRATAPRLSQRIHSMFGGDVFEFDRGGNCWVQIWLSATETVVAYPSLSDRYDWHDESEGLHEFADWIEHLHVSDALELGQVRGRSRYGAIAPTADRSCPTVKWAQAGDWAALARGWYLQPFVEAGRKLAPWP